MKYSVNAQTFVAVINSFAAEYKGLCDQVHMGCCRYFEEYLPGPKRVVFHTRKGLAWRNAWGVLRYSANNAFLAFVHSQHLYEQVEFANIHVAVCPYADAYLPHHAVGGQVICGAPLHLRAAAGELHAG